MHNPRENAFPRHDTIANLLINRAVAVTFLANLRYLKENVAAFQASADRQLFERETFRDDIFSERTRLDLRAACFEVVNLALTEQTNLPVPIARVRVAQNPVLRYKRRLVD